VLAMAHRIEPEPLSSKLVMVVAKPVLGTKVQGQR
jgi:hypothetical protein